MRALTPVEPYLRQVKRYEVSVESWSCSETLVLLVFLPTVVYPCVFLRDALGATWLMRRKLS